MSPQERTLPRITRRTAIGAGLASLFAACAPAAPQPTSFSRNEAAKATAVAKGLPVPSDTPSPLRTPIPVRPSSTSEKPSSYVQTIQREIIRLGIKPSQKEQRLWPAGYVSNSPLPTDETTRAMGRNRVEQVLQLMRQSENPVLSEAAREYDRLKAAKLVSFDVGTNPRVDREGGASTGTRIVDNHVQWHIDFSTPYVLNKTTTTSLAALFTHEIEHVKNGIIFYDNLPKKDLATVLMEFSFRENIINESYIKEEARGNAKEIMAFLYTVGLLQINLEGSNYYLIPHAAKFIELGSNIEDPRWQEYVRTEIVGN